MIMWRSFWGNFGNEEWRSGGFVNDRRDFILSGTMAIRRRTLETLFGFELLVSFMGGRMLGLSMFVFR